MKPQNMSEAAAFWRLGLLRREDVVPLAVQELTSDRPHASNYSRLAGLTTNEGAVVWEEFDSLVQDGVIDVPDTGVAVEIVLFTGLRQLVKREDEPIEGARWLVSALDSVESERSGDVLVLVSLLDDYETGNREERSRVANEIVEWAQRLLDETKDR